MNKVFDEELLITGKKSKKISLQEEYIAKKKQWIEEEKELSQGKEKKKKKSKRKNKKEDDLNENEYNKKNTALDNGKKPLWKEIAETIAAGILIYVCYLLFFK